MHPNLKVPVLLLGFMLSWLTLNSTKKILQSTLASIMQLKYIWNNPKLDHWLSFYNINKVSDSFLQNVLERILWLDALISAFAQ